MHSIGGGVTVSSGSLYKRWLRSTSTSLEHSGSHINSSASADECIVRSHPKSSKLGLAVIIHLTAEQDEWVLKKLYCNCCPQWKITGMLCLTNIIFLFWSYLLFVDVYLFIVSFIFKHWLVLSRFLDLLHWIDVSFVFNFLSVVKNWFEAAADRKINPESVNVIETLPCRSICTDSVKKKIVYTFFAPDPETIVRTK